jgi:pseudouridylate synthase
VEHLIRVADEVEAALREERPVVALETTLVAHGFPAPAGIEVGLASEAAVRAATAAELERYTPDARKLGPRDLAACAVQGAVGATTVGGTLAAGAAVGIRFVGTGGLGGVHRGFPSPPDVSADLGVCARTAALVASSGVKSLLDVPATTELLETLGIPVLGYRTDTMPLFYSADGGPPVTQRVDDVATAARVAASHWDLGACGLLLTNPPPESIDVAHLIEESVAEAARQGVTGQGVTPFVLSRLHERSDGRTRDVNRALAVSNAGLAG